jgi:hypothetical protein
MRNAVEIQDIEEMRRKEGIDDVELRKDIRRLRAGDSVNLTLLTESGLAETLSVRITSIKGLALRGKLTRKPNAAGLSGLGAGFPLVFRAAHVHSIGKGRPSDGG